MPNMKLEYKHVNFSDINSIIDYGKDIYDSFNIEIKKLNKKTSLDEIISRMLLFTNELETIYNIGDALGSSIRRTIEGKKCDI